MGVEIKWLGHSCFRMADGSLAVYTDPYNLAAAVNDGDVICISHAHYDHCSPDDIARIAKPDATIVCTEDVVSQVGNFLKNIVVISPGRTVNVGSLKIEGVAAYNIGKKFHPQDSGWCGYVLNIGGRRIYYAGDSDRIPEMKNLKNIDLAILPVGGTYTMTPQEAAAAVDDIGCVEAIPCHWGSVIGSEADAKNFISLIKCEGILLKFGQSTKI